LQNLKFTGLEKRPVPSPQKLDQQVVLELLRIFDAEIFRGLEKNTGADAFRHFFKYQIVKLGNWVYNDKNVKATGEIIMEKVRKIYILKNETKLFLQKKNSD
jgi:hypothetical protein